MNQQTAEQRKKRKKKKKVEYEIKPDAKAEKMYYNYMRSVIRDISKDVRNFLIPLLKVNKPKYTKDGWADDLTVFFGMLRARYSSFLFRERVKTDVQMPLSMVESKTTAQFLKGVNRAVGVDVQGALKQEGIDQIMRATLSHNVSLVTNMSDDYLNRIENIVYDGIDKGRAPSVIAKGLQSAVGISEKRAKVIARDQVAKLNGAIDAERSENLGIKYYRWSTSKDRRVSGNPSGAYPNSKIKCYRIAQQDVGYGVGVFTYKDGAEYAGETKLHPATAHIGCRCRRIPLIEGVNFELPSK